MSSNEYKDYYAVLGIEKVAGINEIKQKFRQLAKKYHPDRNQGNKAAEAKFKEISEAYNVLSDGDKRTRYDRFGQYWEHGAGASYQTNTSNDSKKVGVNTTDFSQYGNFEEFIDELLGRFSTPNISHTSQGDSPQTATENIDGGDRNANNGFKKHSTAISTETSISLSYAEAFKGTTKRINLGTGIAEVRIPPGVKPGTRIRIPGKEQPGMEDRSRDLYLNVNLDPHSFFSFENGNLICEVPVTPDEAVLGSSIAVPTPDGMVNLKIPAGTSSGQVLRLRGKGWSTPKGSRSDQLVRINVTIPQQISIKEREYYEKIREVRHENPREDLQGISLRSNPQSE